MLEKNILETTLLNNEYYKNKNILLTLIPELKLLSKESWANTLRALKTTPSNSLKVKITLLLHNLGLKNNVYYPELAVKEAEKILLRFLYPEEFMNDIFYLLRTSHLAIEPNNIDNAELILERLDTSYALALTLEPNQIINAVLKLNAIREKIFETPNLTK